MSDRNMYILLKWYANTYASTRALGDEQIEKLYDDITLDKSHYKIVTGDIRRKNRPENLYRNETELYRQIWIGNMK